MLETLPASAELAMAYSNRAQLGMLAGDAKAASDYGRRAIALAAPEALDRPDILCHGLNNVATATYLRHPDEAREMLDRSLEIALALDFQKHAARIFTNRGWVEMRPYAVLEAEEVLVRGIAYCVERDLDTWRDYMRGELAELMISLGRWDEARALAQAVVDNPNAPALSRYPSLLALAVLRTRRGEPVPELLEELERFLDTGREFQRLMPYAELVAERAWLGLEDRERALRLLAEATSLSNDDGDISTLFLWRHALADEGMSPSEFQDGGPVGRLLAGDWKEASALWGERTSPYLSALALLDGDDRALYEALAAFEALGAVAVADHVRHMIRRRLGRVAPRGPRASTRQNSAGLTTREIDVLRLIDAGRPNAEVGLLFIAPKTVDHHVSAILAKLNARSRSEAASIARRRGLLDDVTGQG